VFRLGVVSDSHLSEWWLERYIEFANRERYDAVFHLGDGEGQTRQMKKKLSMPLYAVAGNCDSFMKLPGERVETFGSVRVLATHGHRYDVKWTLTPLSYHAEELGAKVALYGHTHVPDAEYLGGVLMLNPGALMRGLYAELVIDGDRVTPYLKSLDELTLISN